MLPFGKITGLGAFLWLGLGSPAFAWEADVHYALTLWLSQRAGFTYDQAVAVAEGNAGADSFIHDARFLVVYVCTRTSEAEKKDASYEVAKFHFPWTGALPSPPLDRLVEADGGAARAWYRRLIDKEPPRNEKDVDRHLREFGAALHALQDSFSHGGAPGVRCEPDYSWGHPEQRGGPLEHYADHTHYDGVKSKGVDLTIAAARATYDALKAYRAKYPMIATGGERAVDWPIVGNFAKAATKDEKRKALIPMSVKESDSFRICELTIPGEGCPTKEWLGRRWNWLLAKVVPVADSLLKQFFHDFFRAWVLEKDLQKVAAAYVELDSQSRTFYQLPSSGPDIVAGLLGLWLLTDHSTSQQNGHGRKLDSKLAAAFASAPSKDRIVVANVAEAFVPIDRAETWFQVLHVPGTDDFLAVTQFRHTPYDVVILRARRNAQGQWRIVRLAWEITH